MGIRTFNNSITNKRTLTNYFTFKSVDYSEIDPETITDKVLERAYSIAARDARGQINDNDIFEAINEFNLSGEELEKALAPLGDSFVNNIKVIKKNPKATVITTQGSIPNKVEEIDDEAEGGKVVLGAIASALDQKTKNVIDTLTGNYSTTIILELVNLLRKYWKTDKSAKIRNVFVGHYQGGNSDKYYLLFNFDQNRSLAMWGRVGASPQSKLYDDPSDKSFFVLKNAKIKKGYAALIDS